MVENDFGIACYEGKDCEQCGTPLYVSEYCLKNEDGKLSLEEMKKNDLFALGVTFFYIIEKTYPYQRNAKYEYDYSKRIPFSKATKEERVIIDDLLSGKKTAQTIYEEQMSFADKLFGIFKK